MGREEVHPETAIFADDGRVPNNSRPVLIYRGAVDVSGDDPAGRILEMFARNGWNNGWRNGIYTFHHYHSTSHEALGIAGGHGRIRLGGEAGRDFAVEAGDILVLPAGTGHKRLSASADFLVVGAYPEGLDWDLIRAEESDNATHAAAVRRIAQLPVPAKDPVVGAEGPLVRLWQTR